MWNVWSIKFMLALRMRGEHNSLIHYMESVLMANALVRGSAHTPGLYNAGNRVWAKFTQKYTPLVHSLIEILIHFRIIYKTVIYDEYSVFTCTFHPYTLPSPAPLHPITNPPFHSIPFHSIPLQIARSL